MKFFMVLILVVVAALYAPPTPADSDGYYCIGPDYLAFEFSFSMEPRTHQLHIMRFHEPKTWKQKLTIDLPEFNGGPGVCTKTSIKLPGWYAMHIVTWSELDNRKLVLTTTPKSPPGPGDELDYRDGVGSLVNGPEQIANLPTNDPIHSYVLKVMKIRDPDNYCTYIVQSSIEQIFGEVTVDRLELFTGKLPAACGE